ncbi:MAG: hypothetical protein H0T79_16030 [Deltaproteobacteria bacterium]|nr:hypothetical protein [Deltaproteobacteria bacterium]
MRFSFLIASAIASALASPIAITGCYRPAAIGDCEIGCESGACPTGLSCGADRLCFANGGPACNDVTLDAGSDAAIVDGSDVPTCIGSFVQVCFRMPLVLPDLQLVATLDTDSTSGCLDDATVFTVPADPKACVVAGQNVTVTGAVRAVGSRPLIIVALGELHFDAALDVSTNRGANVGPGVVASAVDCNTNGITGSSTTTIGGGGGAGGTFQGRGGMGGGGDVNGQKGGASSAMLPAPTILGPGCKGGNGGDKFLNSTHLGGTGGLPGGVIALIASTITVEPGVVIAAGGGGGEAGADAAGGGGGGAGGLIVFDAQSITNNGRVQANGGGGASGSAIGGAGAVGGNGGTNIALGGDSGLSSNDGNGGTGSISSNLTGAPGFMAQADQSGGGGGGGAGFILVRGMTILGAGTFSPPYFAL